METILANGFFVGIIYGLFGVGVVFVYRGTRIINFGYGQTGMIAAFVFLELTAEHGVATTIALAVALAAAAGIGAATDLLVVRPLRKESIILIMVATYAVGSLLVIFAGRRWGTNPVYFPTLVNGEPVQIAGVAVLPQQLLVLGVSLALLAVLGVLYRFTNLGLRLRALAIDPTAAGLVGVNVARTSLFLWAVSGGMAALTVILVAPLVSFSVFYVADLLLRGLAAALIGGLTSVGGAFAAGLALGMGEAWIDYSSPVNGLSEVLVAIAIILVLLVRPSGLVRSAY